MKFLKKYSYEDAEELKWVWNYTFDRHVCFVRFADGEETWSYPQDTGYNPAGLFNCFRDENQCVNIDVLNQ